MWCSTRSTTPSPRARRRKLRKKKKGARQTWSNHRRRISWRVVVVRVSRHFTSPTPSQEFFSKVFRALLAEALTGAVSDGFFLASHTENVGQCPLIPLSSFKGDSQDKIIDSANRKLSFRISPLKPCVELHLPQRPLRVAAFR